jgi:hypothetical protein
MTSAPGPHTIPDHPEMKPFCLSRAFQRSLAPILALALGDRRRAAETNESENLRARGALALRDKED